MEPLQPPTPPQLSGFGEHEVTCCVESSSREPEGTESFDGKYFNRVSSYRTDFGKPVAIAAYDSTISVVANAQQLPH